MKFSADDILPRKFYERDTAIVARQLLGKILVRSMSKFVLSGIVTKVEAYYGENDSASHASRGRTKRNSVMFGPAGIAYVYFIYGMYYMFNIVTEGEECAGAVLMRSIAPLTHRDVMIQNRNGNKKDIANGPGRLCQAFDIGKQHNKIDLTTGTHLWIAEPASINNHTIISSPRIGIHYANKKDREAPYRFLIKKETEYSE